MEPVSTISAPKLSVVMSVYNGEDFVPSAIECILAQTYRDFEFIIINDGSSDGTLAIMQEYAAKDDRIRIIDQDNTGLTIALCRGIETARGEFIARMDADDISLPERFEKQMAVIEAKPELVAVTSDVQHFTELGHGPGYSSLHRDPRLLPFLLCFENALGGHGQVIFRRSAYDAAGGYNPEFRFSQDYDLWTRLTDQGPFGAVNEVLYMWRSGPDNISTLKRYTQAEYSQRNQQRQYKKIFKKEMDDAMAATLWRFTRHEPPEDSSLAETWGVTSVMLDAVDSYFKKNPGLAHEKYETLRYFSANWWWRLREFGSFSPLLRCAVLGNVVRLGLAASVARIRHGKSSYRQAVFSKAKA